MGVSMGQAGHADAGRTARRVLYWMALTATILGALYLLGLVGKLIVNGSVHAVSSQGVQVITATVAIVWDVVLLILFAALRSQASAERSLFAELALIFMLLVCATSSINWFVQLAVLPKMTGAEPGAAALLDVHNELSITYALEHLGWGLFYGLAVLFAAATIPGGRLGTWISRLLAVGGILSLLHFAGVILGSTLLADLGYVAWGVLLPVTTALLAQMFRIPKVAS